MRNLTQKITFGCLMLAYFGVNAQVGVNTNDPKNDLHVNGGVRIETTPVGSDDDAQNRLMARNVDGDVVEVTAESVLSSLRIPVLAFNAHFGVTDPPMGVPFFAGCTPCVDGQIMALNFNDEDIIVDSPFVDLVNADNATLADEYYRFNTAGDYRVELNMTPIYSGDSEYRVNIVLTIFDSTGSFKAEEAIRLYAGQPTDDSTTYGIPGYITDTRNYAAGDLLAVDLEVATVFGTTKSVESRRVIGASYGSQITITRY